MRAEWIILADAAEVVGSKLYVLGGGWDRLTIPGDFPAQQLVSVAVSFEVEWNETNVRYPMQISFEDEDGKQIANITGQIEAGRPVGLEPGQPQRVQLAFKLPLNFERPGTFAVIARIEDEPVGRTRFTVVRGPQRGGRQVFRSRPPDVN